MPRSRTPPDHVHGTENGYRNYRCRCEDCTDAHRVWFAEYLVRLRAKPIPAGAHGKASTYSNRGCRCGECRAASRERNRRWAGPSLTELRERRSKADS